MDHHTMPLSLMASVIWEALQLGSGVRTMTLRSEPTSSPLPYPIRVHLPVGVILEGHLLREPAADPNRACASVPSRTMRDHKPRLPAPADLVIPTSALRRLPVLLITPAMPPVTEGVLSTQRLIEKRRVAPDRDDALTSVSYLRTGGIEAVSARRAVKAFPQAPITDPCTEWARELHTRAVSLSQRDLQTARRRENAPRFVPLLGPSSDIGHHDAQIRASQHPCAPWNARRTP
ncbi:hypothetical protein DFH09DRAFT_1361266 [Mycena vulgaris]|nr:hypothetical protein DFH09DRAFT_1361266 [Mycena vulgaris]